MHTPLYSLLLVSLLTSFVAAQSCPEVTSQVGLMDSTVVITAGSEEADLTAFFVLGRPVTFPLSGTLELTASTTVFAYRNSVGLPRTGTFAFAAYPIVPDANATVTISQAVVSNRAIEDISFTLFEGTFDPAADNSDRLVASTFTETGNLPALTATLTGGVQYTLVVQSGQAYDRPYPRTFTLTLRSAGELQPVFYTGGTLPDYFSYTYLALLEDSIVAASERADFRSLSEGLYSVRGLVYDSRAPLPTSLAELSTTCAQLSLNSQAVLIASH